MGKAKREKGEGSGNSRMREVWREWHREGRDCMGGMAKSGGWVGLSETMERSRGTGGGSIG